MKTNGSFPITKIIFVKVLIQFLIAVEKKHPISVPSAIDLRHEKLNARLWGNNPPRRLRKARAQNHPSRPPALRLLLRVLLGP